MKGGAIPLDSADTAQPREILVFFSEMRTEAADDDNFLDAMCGYVRNCPGKGHHAGSE